MLRNLLPFYAVAFVWSGAFAVIPLVGPRVVPEVPAQVWMVLAGVPYMFGPLVAAAVGARREGVRFVDAVGIRGRPNVWWVATWMAPLPFLAAVVLASAALPGIELATPVEAMRARYGGTVPPEALAEAEASLAQVPPALVAIGGAIAGLIAGATINALAAFGEEAGWRGYLPRILREARFWPAALGTGASWGLWHAPLILQGYDFPEAPVAGVAQMTLACALLAPPILWLRGKAGNVLAAAFLHGTLNGTAGLVLLFLVGGTTFTAGPLGLPACAVLLVVNAVLFAVLPRGARMGEIVPTSGPAPATTPPATPA